MALDIPWGTLLLAAAVWLTAGAAYRLAPRILPVASDGERYLRSLLVAVLLAVSTVAALGFAGALYPVAILAVAAAVFVACRRLPAPEVSARRAWPRGVLGPAILTLLLVACDLAAQLPASPVDWDAATYHLYLPARWLQEGHIFHLPTVFGDNAAAFAPQNGALFFAWQMALSGRDAVVNVSQLLCLAFLGLALFCICRLLDAGRAPALLAALTLPWLAPVRRWTFSANVDLLMVAFATGALYWMLRYRRLPETPVIAACGLAAGLAAGTKTLGLPLAALCTLPLAWTVVRRRRFADAGVFVGCAVAAGGWWYLLNLWRYGNPLFPVKLELGPLELPGAYGAAAIRAGEFHLGSSGEMIAAVLDQYGVTTCLLIALGLLALAWRSVLNPVPGRGGREAIMLLLQAIAWGLFFAFVVPHNDQARFLMPTLVISLTGWALVLDRMRRASPVAAYLVWLAGVAAAALASRPWHDWTASYATLTRAGVDAGRWIQAAMLCGAVAAGLYALRRRLGRRLPAVAAAGLAWVVVTIATLHADAARQASFAAADYRGWAEGYLPFNHPAQPAARIAYTGANVPYALAGVGWRHRVVYADTQGEQGDGFYQHWQRDPQEHPYHKPGLYRGRDDVDLWLRHLEEFEVDTVVIFRLHRAESRYIRSTPVGPPGGQTGGFPIEQAWVRQRPKRFEPVFTGPAAEIYRLLPSRDRPAQARPPVLEDEDGPPQ